MKRTIKTVALFLAVFCLVSCSPFDFVDTASGENAVDMGYCYEDLAISVTVDDSHAYHVTWDITIEYLEPSHGFYIFTPYIAEVDLQGADYGRYQMDYSDFKVTGAPFEVYTEDLNYVIKVGDPYKLVNGLQKYTLSYVCEVGKDFTDALDVLYWNVVGSYMDTVIKNVSFDITLPHAVEKGTAATLYRGEYGSAVNERVITEDGLTFSYTANGLAEYNGLTLYLELPDGYYTDTSDWSWLMVTLIVLIGVGTLVLCFFIYRKHGVDKKVLPTVEFSAPDGMDSAAAGFVLDGSADDKDIVSLIFWFADQGYLTVEEGENDTFILRKKKELPDDAEKYQKVVFGGFFDGRDAVSVSDLNERFFATNQMAKTSLTRSWSKRIFDAAATRWQVIAGFLSSLPMLVCILWSLFASKALIDTGVIVMLLAFVGFFYFGEFLLCRWVTSKKSFTLIKRGGMLGLGVLVTGLPCVAFSLLMPAFLVDPAFISSFSVVFSLLCVPFIMFTGKKTDEGAALFAKLVGFRSFIEKAEKGRIEKLVKEDPSYFYHVLPYAYALGVTDAWVKQFEKITLEPPTWYVYTGADMFSTMIFMSMFRRSAFMMSRAMVSRPQVKTGGGRPGGMSFGGGGGFSGGGFGGGGGGRW